MRNHCRLVAVAALAAALPASARAGTITPDQIAGWWLFPAAQQWLAGKDCIASGRTNCYAQGVVDAPAANR